MIKSVKFDIVIMLPVKGENNPKNSKKTTSDNGLVTVTEVQCCHWARQIEISLSHYQNIFL
jgi:hypothetical protein